jgi:hypothetical protein
MNDISGKTLSLIIYCVEGNVLLMRMRLPEESKESGNTVADNAVSIFGDFPEVHNQHK